MPEFLWGMFFGGACVAVISLFASTAAENDTNQLHVVYAASWTLVFIFLLLAFGTMVWQGNGSMQIIPPTPTPLLGR